MDDSGIHNSSSKKFDVKLAKSYDKISRIEVIEDLEQRKSLKIYLSCIWHNYKILNKNKKLFIIFLN